MMDAFQIILLSFAIFGELLRLIFQIFGINLIKKFDFITQPSRFYMILYHILTILVCIYGIRFTLQN